MTASTVAFRLERNLRRELQDSRIKRIVRCSKCRIRGKHARRWGWSGVIVLRGDNRVDARVDVADVAAVKNVKSFEHHPQVNAFANRNFSSHPQIYGGIARSFESIPADERRTVVARVAVVSNIRIAANGGRQEMAAL